MAEHLVESFWQNLRERVGQSIATSDTEPPGGLPGDHPLERQAVFMLRERLKAKEAIGYASTWEPQPGPQTALIETYRDFPELFYGGARGGGKSDGMLGDWLLNQAMRFGKSAKGVFFRRQVKNLEETEARAQELYPETGATLNRSTKTWTWPNGATLKFRHLWDLAASDLYKSHQYTWICFEQLEDWPDPEPVNRLRGTLRSPDGIPCVWRATGNPGGPGHGWVKARYVTPAPDGFEEVIDPRSGLPRVFIPARVSDNRYLGEEYVAQLKMSGPAHIVKAWLDGNWDIMAGGYFAEVWRPDVERGLQVLKPFEPLPSWYLIRSFDWGSAKPSSLGLWAVTDGTPLPENTPYPGKVFPPGSLIRFGEWYTVARDESGNARPNKGLRLPPRKLGAGIAKRCLGRVFAYGVADPSIFDDTAGDSIYEQLVSGSETYYSSNGVGATETAIEFGRGRTSRIAGLQLVTEMLEEAAKEHPEQRGLWIMNHCREWLRTVPVIQIDSRKPEDVDTDDEDHSLDETRYAAMSLGEGMESHEL